MIRLRLLIPRGFTPGYIMAPLQGLKDVGLFLIWERNPPLHPTFRPDAPYLA